MRDDPFVVLGMPTGVHQRITNLGGTASFDEVQQYFADQPTTPITKAKIGGTLTSVQGVQRRVGPTSAPRLLQRNERARLYDIDPALVKGLWRAFAIAEARPGLLRGAPDTGPPDAAVHVRPAAMGRLAAAPSARQRATSTP